MQGICEISSSAAGEEMADSEDWDEPARWMGKTLDPLTW